MPSDSHSCCSPAFPAGDLPAQKPAMPLSAAMHRLYDQFPHLTPQNNPLYTRFRYTRLEGLEYNDGDGTLTRRDPTKVIRVGGKYYVWYTRRHTPTPPQGAANATEEIPSTDWDLSEIWCATSEDGFVWEEQGVAVERMAKPIPGWRTVCTPDILVWRGRYYLYFQSYVETPGTRGDFCPVSAAVADSPAGPWSPTNRIVVDNGPPGTWDHYTIHDPYPLVYQGKIYLYYKAQPGGTPPVRMQGVALADDPLGPFVKHPLNPVINSGHETALFPFKEGIAAIVIRDGNEHSTIQYAPDGVNFQVASLVSLTPNAGGPYVPDAFTDTGNGQGITWGLSHFTNAGGRDTQHTILTRFDCELTQTIHDPSFKQTNLLFKPEVHYTHGLSAQQRADRARDARLAPPRG